MAHTYKNIILTNHAYERAVSRSLALHSIYETVKFPDKKFKQATGETKYIKTIQNRKYHVVATYKKDEDKYLVISTWVRGEEDKVPLLWQLITLPFKICWWIIQFQFKIIWNLLKKLW